MAAKDALGRYGERLVAERLAAAGWQVLDRNWRGTRGELDLVAMDGRELVVGRGQDPQRRRLRHPAEAVTAAKLARLRRLAGQWLTEHEVHAGAVRVDVVAVRTDRGGDAAFEHLRGVL